MPKTITALALVGLIGAAPAVSASAYQDVDKAIAAATAAVDRANSVGFEWRDTGDVLKKARAAAEAGDKQKALDLAREAEVQGELGYRQYLQQRNAGPHF